MVVEHVPAVVVGSGLAGMTAALSLAPLPTLVLTKTDAMVGGSTPWAQGGVAFPRDRDDQALHVHDTIVSGAGHTDQRAAEALVAGADAARDWLEAQGIAFDRDPSGHYQFGREGAHSTRRILHVGADATGLGLATGLATRLQAQPHLTLRPRALAMRLLPGALLTYEADRGLVLIRSPRILLAGGGLGQLFAATTAPAEGTGDTIALALEAGADVRDLEMIQFHPTALAVRPAGAPNLSLLTEALRGEGALLVTADTPDSAPYPLDTGHPQGSLGPRDVLSRAIFRRQQAGFPVWLDARAVPHSATKFPTVTRLCGAVGLDPVRDLLPVVPAVHYTMGGITTDLRGRTSLAGVWAAGETACTGVHGGNRLASNSLLECVVWGRAAALDARDSRPVEFGSRDPATPIEEKLVSPSLASELRRALQTTLSLVAGPIRSGTGLQKGLDDIRALQHRWADAASADWVSAGLTFDQLRAILETRGLLTLGPAVLRHALARTTSLGAHFRRE